MSTHISRRDLLTATLGGLLLAPSGARGAVTNADALLSNARGGYLYLPAPLIKFRSLGVLAAPGFEIVRATFRRPSPFPEGLADVERHLRSAGRSIEALCGLEMRSGKQATLDEFIAFNGVYLQRLLKAGALIDGQVPLAVTNVALPGTQAAHRIHAFTYTVPTPSPSKRPPAFVLAGIPDVRNVGPKAEAVANGDVSPAGLAQKVAFIIETIEGLLSTLGARWSDATGVQLYTMQDLQPILANLLVPAIGDAALAG